MNTDKIYAQLLAAEYAPSRSRKVIALKKLDSKAKRPAVVFAYVLGIVAILLFIIAAYMLILQMIWGIVFISISFCIMALNYPLFKKLLKKAKHRYAFEIVELAKEICEDAP